MGFSIDVLNTIKSPRPLYFIFLMAQPRKTPRELIDESWNEFKDAWIYLAKSTWKIFTWTYKAIDALDKTIGTIWSPSKNKIIDFAKNNLIKILLAGGLITYGWVKTHNYYKDHIEHNKETHVQWNSNELVYVPTASYPLFQNKKITARAPLTKHYLWLDVLNKDDIIIWDTLVLHPSQTLHDLRAEKILKYGKKNIMELDAIDISTMTDKEQIDFKTKYPIDATYLFVVRPYIDGKINKTQVSIDEFISLTEQIIRETENSIETYDGWLTGDKQKLLHIAKQELTGESIVAYAMTELCENKEEWEMNIQLFDMLLKNAGVEFLSFIPAMYDPKTSYWVYQFTEYALYDTPNEKRWASKVNKYIKNKNNRLPGSVMYLNTWKNQTQAAYMFAVYNVAIGLSNLSDNEARKLLSYYTKDKTKFIDNITQLIAMCHHFPVDNKALQRWIQNDFTQDIYTYGKARTYGKASKTNYKSLKRAT